MGEQIDMLVRKLREEGEALEARLAALPPEAWERPVYGEGQAWMVRDVLAHLVSAERGHQRLIADVAAGGSGSPPDSTWMSTTGAMWPRWLAARRPTCWRTFARCVRDRGVVRAYPTTTWRAAATIRRWGRTQRWPTLSASCLCT